MLKKNKRGAGCGRKLTTPSVGRIQARYRSIIKKWTRQDAINLCAYLNWTYDELCAVARIKPGKSQFSNTEKLVLEMIEAFMIEWRTGKPSHVIMPIDVLIQKEEGVGATSAKDTTADCVNNPQEHHG